jgi:glyoxylase-like metal-dependent hydrolase (beta-lactamase superfamily II)
MEPSVEVLPGVHEIKSQLGDRHIQQYPFVGEQVTLLDSGVFSTPESTIFPFLEKIGVAPNSLSVVIAMHADADHHGGLSAIRSIAPSVTLACHAADRPLIESPEYLYQHRYNFLAHDHGLRSGREGMIYCPNTVKIDALFNDGETIEASADWKLNVWHVPGHSDGHLAIYDGKNRAVFTSDAVQADGYPTVAGKMAFGPTYYAVNSYLATIAFLDGQPIKHLYSGHWPAAHGCQVREFLSRSRDFVDDTEHLIGSYLKEHRRVTLKDLLRSVSPRLGTWPPENADMLQFALYGHLQRLKDRGLVGVSRTSPVEFHFASTALL